MGLDIYVVLQRRDRDHWIDVATGGDRYTSDWSHRDKEANLFLLGCIPTLTDYYNGWETTDDIPAWFTPNPNETPFPQPRGLPPDFTLDPEDNTKYTDMNWHHGQCIGDRDSRTSWLTHADLLALDDMQKNVTLISTWLRLLDTMRLGAPEDVRLVFGFA